MMNKIRKFFKWLLGPFNKVTVVSFGKGNTTVVNQRPDKLEICSSEEIDRILAEHIKQMKQRPTLGFRTQPPAKKAEELRKHLDTKSSSTIRSHNSSSSRSTSANDDDSIAIVAMSSVYYSSSSDDGGSYSSGDCGSSSSSCD